MTHAAPLNPLASPGLRRLLPSAAASVDAGLLMLLAMLALIGFRTTFSGYQFLLAGVLGLLLGVVVAQVACATPAPLWTAAVLTLAAFFLLGGVAALRGSALFGILPTPDTVRGLGQQSVHGWKDLLTTLPPVDGRGPLLVLPYLLCLLCGVAGMMLARRTSTGFAPVVAPTLLLAAVILLGTQKPSTVSLQGGAFATIGLAWMALRSQRVQPAVPNGAGRLVRASTGVALLLVAGLAAVLVGPNLPGSGAHRRLVLRDYVQPPFNVGQYPSPLAGFRKYLGSTSGTLRNTLLFTVTGLPADQRVRLATLDSYDGSVWAATGGVQAGQLVGDDFQRVGEQIANPIKGKPVTFTVSLAGGYSDVWLPDAGAVTAVDFAGRDGSQIAGSFRYNLVTNTGIVPQRLVASDRYTVHALLPAGPQLIDSDALASSGALPDSTTAFLKSQAQQWAGSSNNPASRVRSLYQHLLTGRYSDGGAGQSQYLPGHSIFRLSGMVNSAQLVGDGEQYAAVLALMINQLGVPARVVLGARSEQGRVYGRDVEAWVEVERADGRWAEIPASAFTPKTAPDKTPPQPVQQAAAGQFVPPPSAVKPRSTLADADLAGSTSNRTGDPPPGTTKHGLPAFIRVIGTWVVPPICLIALLLITIVGLKAVRRQRRRTRGSSTSRFVQGWYEVLDHARDLGTALPRGRTRREQAGLLGYEAAGLLASAADRAVFGPGDPDQAALDSFWVEVGRMRKQMSSGVGRMRRLRAAVSLASFRNPRPRTVQ